VRDCVLCRRETPLAALLAPADRLRRRRPSPPRAPPPPRARAHRRLQAPLLPSRHSCLPALTRSSTLGPDRLCSEAFLPCLVLHTSTTRGCATCAAPRPPTSAPTTPSPLATRTTNADTAATSSVSPAGADCAAGGAARLVLTTTRAWLLQGVRHLALQHRLRRRRRKHHQRAPDG